MYNVAWECVGESKINEIAAQSFFLSINFTTYSLEQIDHIEIYTGKPDPNLLKYTRKHHLYEVFEALLGGLSVMLPTNPRRWIIEKLQLLYDIGFISLNWDTFIDPDMKPMHPYVDHELMHSLFGTSKLEFVSYVKLLPTPEMIATAYAAQKQSILKKCLRLLFCINVNNVLMITTTTK
ncbi:hypothetical protein MN116_003751 [Schistosoma mekongi]|uniref:Uncharacterized protein n=1 Tax=Schistosoma mekongi TaxID=38744 RepID=A0AAE1ZEB0_SCHME|nr:hypothetical protein MN116_003751 [Schistosoma mekongi]